MTATRDYAARLQSLAGDLGYLAVEVRLRDLCARIEQDRTHVVVVGEFNRGKSTLVNALVGRDLLPVDIVPTTAAIWTLRQGPELSIVRMDRDGSCTALASDAASLKELSADGARVGQIHHVDATVPNLALGADVVVVDTPGVNDINHQRADVTYGYLEAADVAVMVLDASTPFTRSEMAFIEGQLLSTTLGKMVFVLNKADRLDGDELEEAEEFAQERLDTLVGDAIPLVVTDGARILQARLDGRDDTAETWGWLRLRDTLKAVAQAAGGVEARGRKYTWALATIARALREEVSAELDVLAQDSEARAAAEQTWAVELAGHHARLEALVSDARLHGRDRLKTMLTHSMQQEVSRWAEQRQTAIASMPDVSVYAKDALPRELQLFAKQWFERRQPDIEQFIVGFNHHLGQEFQRHFGGTIVPTPHRFGASSAGANATVAGAEGGGPPEALLETALPAAAYLALAFLGTGPFAIVGLVGGGLVARHLSAQRRAAEKTALLHDLEGAILAVMDAPLRNLHNACDGWFESVESEVRARFEAGLHQRTRRVGLAHQLTDSGSVGERTKTLRGALDTLAQLEATWHSTSST